MAGRTNFPPIIPFLLLFLNLGNFNQINSWFSVRYESLKCDIVHIYNTMRRADSQNIIPQAGHVQLLQFGEGATERIRPQVADPDTERPETRTAVSSNFNEFWFKFVALRRPNVFKVGNRLSRKLWNSHRFWCRLWLTKGFRGKSIYIVWSWAEFP